MLRGYSVGCTGRDHDGRPKIDFPQAAFANMGNTVLSHRAKEG